MSSDKKRHRAVIHIPEPQQVFLGYEIDEALDMIDHYCGYDCYSYDCGLECPDDCPILYYYDVLNHHQEQEEQEVLKQLGLNN